MSPSSPSRLILASTSKYRQALLRRLGVPFETRAPAVDEDKLKDPRLSPSELALHLAGAKARSLAAPGCIVLGGDQLVALDDQILGKPGTIERAREQLTRLSGRTHELITAITLVGEDGLEMEHVDHTYITLKPLTEVQIARVVEWDRPLDCAGAYKIEAHGIALVERLETEDFTAIEGLPLLALSRMLNQWGLVHP